MVLLAVGFSFPMRGRGVGERAQIIIETDWWWREPSSSFSPRERSTPHKTRVKKKDKIKLAWPHRVWSTQSSKWSQTLHTWSTISCSLSPPLSLEKKSWRELSTAELSPIPIPSNLIKTIPESFKRSTYAFASAPESPLPFIPSFYFFHFRLLNHY